MKKLYRTRNRSILGVCGGLGAYYDIDPTVLRLLTVVLVLFTGIFPGVIAYILAGLIIPEEPN